MLFDVVYACFSWFYVLAHKDTWQDAELSIIVIHVYLMHNRFQKVFSNLLILASLNSMDSYILCID